MTSLVRSELALKRSSTFIWLGSIVALMLLVIAFYPSVRDNPSLDSIYADLSPAAQGLLGGADLVSPAGYLNTQLFAFFLPAVLLVLGLGRGAAALAGEEEGRTLDLLLAQPVSRQNAFLQKAAAVVIWLLLATITALIPLLALNDAVGFHLPVSNLTAICGQLLLMTVALSMACQAIAAATGRRALGLAVVTGYAFVSYLVYGLAGSIAWLEHLLPLTVWRWYLGNDPLTNGWGAKEVIVLALASVVAAWLGATVFARRDLSA